MLSVLALDLVATTPHLSPGRIDNPPVIDGQLDDEVWRTAPASDRFTQKYPNSGGAPSERTTVSVVYDDEAIYFGFDCPQVRSPQVRRLTRRDRSINSDHVAVDLDTRRDGVTAFSFQVSSAGVLLDGIRFNDVNLSTMWDETWEAAASSGPGGWSAEMRIPLRVLRFDDLEEQTWGLQVRRYVASRDEVLEWAFIPRTAAAEVSRYGRLGPLRGLPSSTGLEIRPFALARFRRRDPSSEVLGQGWDRQGALGLDAKWLIARNLTIAATFLPDFGQVEADQIVLNLSTFETLFPEKRPFFLEGLELFQTPLQVLYTRRIGRVADAPTLLDGEEPFELPVPSAIYAAGKLVGRVGPRLSIGALSAVAAEATVRARGIDGQTFERVADPMTTFQVLRLKQELGSNSHVGLLAAATLRLEPVGRYPIVQGEDGNLATLCPGGAEVLVGARCEHDGYVAAIDARWRSDSGDYVAGAQAVGSLGLHGPERQLADGTLIQPGELGYGARTRLAKEGGEHWLGSVLYQAFSPRLELNDAGFLQRQSFHELWTTLGYRTTERVGPTQSTLTQLEAFQQRNWHGLHLGSGIQLNTTGQLTSLWSFWLEVHHRQAYFDDRELGDGTALERQGLWGGEASVGSDPGKPLALRFFVLGQRRKNGYRVSGEGALVVRPAARLDIELGSEVEHTDGEPRYVGQADAGKLLFGRQRVQGVGITLRTTYTFTPTLTLQAYAQLLLAAVHYHDYSAHDGDGVEIRLRDLVTAEAPSSSPDFDEATLALTVLLRWEYALGHLLYLVYTRSQTPSAGEDSSSTIDLSRLRRGPAVDVLLLKLSYWWI